MNYMITNIKNPKKFVDLLINLGINIKVIDDQKEPEMLRYATLTFRIVDNKFDGWSHFNYYTKNNNVINNIIKYDHIEYNIIEYITFLRKFKMKKLL